MYSDIDSLVAPSDSSYDSDLAASSDSDDDCSDRVVRGKTRAMDTIYRKWAFESSTWQHC
jgi:hypothetical protein